MRYNPRPTTSQQACGGGTRIDAVTDVTNETVFLSNLPVIDDVVGQTCRRHRLSPTEADDFRSDVHLHFIERNYERLVRFEGRSTLRTYITVCVQRCYLDYRNKLWGKWRPSMDATRLGPDGVLLERMVVCGKMTIDQACEALKTNHGIAIESGLAVLCERLAQRPPARERVSDEEAERLASSDPLPETNVLRAEQDFLVRRVRAACARASESLTPEERLILRMRFDDISVADIARALHLNQKRLYRTIDRLLAELRTRLEADGISRDEMRTLFASGALAGMESPHHQPAPAGDRPDAATERTSWLQRR